MKEQFLHDTTSLCATCKSSIPALLWQVQQHIWMRKFCDQHGQQDILISPNTD